MSKVAEGLTALLSSLQRTIRANRSGLSPWRIIAVTYYGARFGIVSAASLRQAEHRLAEVKSMVETKPLLRFRTPAFADPLCISSQDIVRLIVRGPDEAGITADLWDEVCFPRRGVF